jgi:tetratricopeptide (TPR) repeat protein
MMCAASALYDGMGYFSAARAVAARAIIAAPDSADAHIQHGVVCRHVGDFQAAVTSFRKAIALRPLAVRAYNEIAQMGALSDQNETLETLTRVFDQVSSDPERALLAGHAIAKLYEDRGEYGLSFDWLERAKAGVKRQYAYDEAQARRTHAAAESISRSAEGDQTREPIFIVGLPRTGTTLVDRIVASHREVQSAGEISNWPVLINCVADAPRAALPTSDTLKAAGAFDAAILGSSYVESTRPFTGERPHFTDKSPNNYLLAPLIHRALPNARIICVRRDAMDTCVSMFKQPLPARQYSFISDIADCARHFLVFSRFIERCRALLPADRFTEVRYESLVDNFETETRRLIDFCGLAWDEQCLRFHENDTPVATPSGQQVRAPIYRTSLGKSRKYGEKLRPALEILADGGVSDFI